MKKLFVTLGAATLLLACDISGQLDVVQPLTLRSSTTTLQLDPGHYTASVDEDSSDLTINVCVGSQTKRITIATAGEVPDQNGVLHVSAEESGQAFDLSAQITTSYQTTPIETTTQTCSSPYGLGHQTVDQHNVITVTSANAYLYTPTTTRTVAHFTGTNESVDTVTDNEGPCIANYYPPVPPPHPPMPPPHPPVPPPHPPVPPPHPPMPQPPHPPMPQPPHPPMPPPHPPMPQPPHPPMPQPPHPLMPQPPHPPMPGGPGHGGHPKSADDDSAKK